MREFGSPKSSSGIPTATDTQVSSAAAAAAAAAVAAAASAEGDTSTSTSTDKTPVVMDPAATTAGSTSKLKSSGKKEETSKSNNEDNVNTNADMKTTTDSRSHSAPIVIDGTSTDTSMSGGTTEESSSNHDQKYPLDNITDLKEKRVIDVTNIHVAQSQSDDSVKDDDNHEDGNKTTMEQRNNGINDENSKKKMDNSVHSKSSDNSAYENIATASARQISTNEESIKIKDNLNAKQSASQTKPKKAMATKISRINESKKLSDGKEKKKDNVNVIITIDDDSATSTMEYDPEWKPKLLLTLIKQIQTHVDSFNLFLKRVDPIEDDCPDYYDVVKKEDSMSFQTMELLVQQKELVDIEDIIICLQRIVKCANLYYGNNRSQGHGNYILKQANLILKRSEPILDEAMDVWRELEAIELFHRRSKDGRYEEEECERGESINDDHIKVDEEEEQKDRNKVDSGDEHSSSDKNKDCDFNSTKDGNFSEVKIKGKIFKPIEVQLPKGPLGMFIERNEESEIGIRVSGFAHDSCISKQIGRGDIIISFMGKTISNGNIAEFTESLNKMRQKRRRIVLIPCGDCCERTQRKRKLRSKSLQPKKKLNNRPQSRKKDRKSLLNDGLKNKRGMYSSSLDDQSSNLTPRKLRSGSGRNLKKSIDEGGNTVEAKDSNPTARRSSRKRNLENETETRNKSFVDERTRRSRNRARSANQKVVNTQKKKEVEVDQSSKPIVTSVHSIPLNQRTKGSRNQHSRSPKKKQLLNSSYQRLLKDLITKIRNKVDEYELFTHTSDLSEYTDYFDVIDKEKEYMNFTIMLELVDMNEITCIEDVERNLDKIIHCTEKYFKQDDFEWKKASKIKAKSSGIIRIARQKWMTLQKKEKLERFFQEMMPFDEKSHTNFSGGTTKSPQKILPVEKKSLELRKCGKKVDYKEMGIDEIITGNWKNESKSQNDDGKDDLTYLEGSQIPMCRRDLSTSEMKRVTDRNEWKELLPKLCMVCNEAARRMTLRINQSARLYEKPLSEVYIEERIIYDQPIHGFIVETKEQSKRLQGFIMTSNFVTWRKTLRWTTDYPAALITPTDHRVHATDRDFQLANELENQNRSGDPSCGYTIERVCEISLLGGIGCGGILLNRAIEELKKSGQYDYIVLQATKVAIAFYEKHGFVRVGAVTRFSDNEALPEVAYRHWSEIVDGEAVEPSYMMARRVNEVVTSMSISKEQRLTYTQREMDIKSALRSTFQLLSGALSIKVGRSNVYINSYREMLSAAKDFAMSAGDDALIFAINKALGEIKDSLTGTSKALIRTELKIPKTNKVGPTCSRPHEEFMVDTKVQVVCDSKSTLSDVKLTALLSRAFLQVDPFLNIRLAIKCDDKYDKNLDANIRVSSSDSQTNDDMADAMYLAIGNLRSFCNITSQDASKRRKSQQVVKKNQQIMIKVQGFDQLPLWVDGEVVKCFNKKSCGKDNLYSVLWFNSAKTKWVHENRILDNSNRGVGRK